MTALFKRSNVCARVLRCALEVQQYKLTIEYVKGKANVAADALSRRIPTTGRDEGIIPRRTQGCVCEVREEQVSEWMKELKSSNWFYNG